MNGQNRSNLSLPLIFPFFFKTSPNTIFSSYNVRKMQTQVLGNARVLVKVLCVTTLENKVIPMLGISNRVRQRRSHFSVWIFSGPGTRDSS